MIQNTATFNTLLLTGTLEDSATGMEDYDPEMEVYEPGQYKKDDNPPLYEHPPSYDLYAHERQSYLDSEELINAADEQDKPAPIFLKCNTSVTLVLIIASAITVAFIIVVIQAWFRMLYQGATCETSRHQCLCLFSVVFYVRSML